MTALDDITRLEAERSKLVAAYEPNDFHNALRLARIGELGTLIAAAWDRRRLEKQGCTRGEIQPVRMPK